ncbi:MAG: site-specific integrase [Candidatus Hadarchaeum sp.]
MNTETIHYLTQDELKRLLSKVASKRDKALLLLAYSYGLRASEIGMLRREDIDFQRLKIRITRLKNSISSEYPLRPEVAKALKSYLRTRKDNSPILFTSKRGLPISRRTLDWLMKKYGTAAELPKEKQHFHCLKHSIATHLIDAGADIMFVKDWLGHKNIQNTLVYAQLTSRTRDEQARRILASSHIVR